MRRRGLRGAGPRCRRSPRSMEPLARRHRPGGRRFSADARSESRRSRAGRSPACESNRRPSLSRDRPTPDARGEPAPGTQAGVSNDAGGAAERTWNIPICNLVVAEVAQCLIDQAAESPVDHGPSADDWQSLDCIQTFNASPGCSSTNAPDAQSRTSGPGFGRCLAFVPVYRSARR